MALSFSPTLDSITDSLFEPSFTAPDMSLEDVFATVGWSKRDVVVRGKEKITFSQADVEAPAHWSDTAVTIVASKYFSGKLGTPERESSVKQLIGRVVETLSRWGRQGGYFVSVGEQASYRNDLAYLLIHQIGAFNSPVWFNVGLPETRGYGFYFDRETQSVQPVQTGDFDHPQCSACFINSVEDRMESILDLAKTEGMLFKYGSGSGTNLSTLREENAYLSSGGRASGPLSFMKGFDAFAGVIKSGGKTRRAAKMVILNVDHPDIEQFIGCKPKEEKKAYALIEAGYDASLDGEAYSSVFFQNANNSVRVSDGFMEAVVADGEWTTKSVGTQEPVKTYRARELMRQIEEATHQCGDPGLQFDSTINRWHTSKASGRINASNPCSEYVFLDDSACNLASLNLMKFLGENSEFDIAAYRAAISVFLLSQEILVDNSSYPTQKIARNSHDFRPLGLGYANLGALLMALGIPYDSDRGRVYAGSLTAILGGQAYLTSAHIAERLGAFARYDENRHSFLDVVGRHQRAAAIDLDSTLVPLSLYETAQQCWRAAYKLGEQTGFRNAQVTVLAPCGTIGFMMDCDTTGVEPELGLIKTKSLAGGGTLTLTNGIVPQALRHLGYSDEQSSAVIGHVQQTGSVEGAPHLRLTDYAVFDTAVPASGSTRSIAPKGHIRMMAAVQPFLSGAISKTVNLPVSATVGEVIETYVESWKLGLKAVAIYRDGSKRAQPLSSGRTTAVIAPSPASPVRRKLPDERPSLTHKFSVAGHEGYVTVGLYPDATPGEVFISMNKAGSTISGLMDTIAVSVSTGLQYGVPLQFYVDKFSHVRFEPSGWTGHSQLPYAKSVVDYIFRWLGMRFLGQKAATEITEHSTLTPTEPKAQQVLAFDPASDAPLCADCGGIMSRKGTCFYCGQCGSSSGGCS